jgi:hypothetical protein
VGSLGDLSNGELVVAEDGSIPAEQLQRLGVEPGTHLRVVDAATGGKSASLAGSLPDLPDLTWEDFEEASAPARQNFAQ